MQNPVPSAELGADMAVSWTAVYREPCMFFHYMFFVTQAPFLQMPDSTLHKVFLAADIVINLRLCEEDGLSVDFLISRYLRYVGS